MIVHYDDFNVDCGHIWHIHGIKTNKSIAFVKHRITQTIVGVVLSIAIRPFNKRPFSACCDTLDKARNNPTNVVLIPE